MGRDPRRFDDRKAPPAPDSPAGSVCVGRTGLVGIVAAALPFELGCSGAVCVLGSPATIAGSFDEARGESEAGGLGGSVDAVSQVANGSSCPKNAARTRTIRS